MGLLGSDQMVKGTSIVKKIAHYQCFQACQPIQLSWRPVFPSLR